MKFEDITLGQIEMIRAFLGPKYAFVVPEFDGRVIAHFIGRFIFVCHMEIRGGFCYLTNVKNVRFFDKKPEGLGSLAKNGPDQSDKLDDWPDQIIPLDKLGPVMSINEENWNGK